MSNVKFSPRQLLFLEFFFSGCSMKSAARAAGYRGSTPQALCNTGRAILDKFSKIPFPLFCQAGARERNIAKLIFEMAENAKSGTQQLKVLKILSKCIKGVSPWVGD